jgi:hypothetical protein
MLTASPYYSITARDFLPHTPSPLSPRCGNSAQILGHARHSGPFSTPMTAPAPQTPPESQTDGTAFGGSTFERPQPAADQPLRQPPVTRQLRPLSNRLNKDTLPERRRNLFLNKVRRGRDDKKWEVRSEDLARLDWMNEKKGWEREVLRNAPPTWDQGLGMEDDVEEGMLWSQQGSQGSSLQNFAPTLLSSGMHGTRNNNTENGRHEFEEVDFVLLREEAELEALVGLMSNEEEQTHYRDKHDGMVEDGLQDERSSAFGSDDEAYEDIFMDLVDQQHNGQLSAEQKEQGEEMDLSG